MAPLPPVISWLWRISMQTILSPVFPMFSTVKCFVYQLQWNCTLTNLYLNVLSPWGHTKIIISNPLWKVEIKYLRNFISLTGQVSLGNHLSERERGYFLYLNCLHKGISWWDKSARSYLRDRCTCSEYDWCIRTHTEPIFSMKQLL